MNDAKDRALELCQVIGMTTMFSGFNNGMTLPLEVSKKIALVVIEDICPCSEYWENIKTEINNLK